MVSMLNNFEIAAGISAVDLSILIRSIFASILTVWSAWVLYKQFLLYTAKRTTVVEFGSVSLKLFSTWLLLMLVVAIT